jgi:serine/threonine protein kinase
MLATVKELERLGVKVKSPTRQSLEVGIQFATPSSIPHWQSTKSQLTHETTTLSEFTPVLKGTFGSLYIVHRETPEKQEYCFGKLSPGHSMSLYREGLIQAASWATLNSYGLVQAIPRVIDIFHHPTLGLGLCLERIPGSTILSDFLQSQLQWKTACVENDLTFLSILSQLSLYLLILQRELGLQHGDLKSTNILLVRPTDLFSCTVHVDGRVFTYRASLEAILIDFGFSSVHGAQTQHDMSRDIFFFLSSLWNIPDFRKSVTPKLATAVVRWLHDGQKSWARWLEVTTDDNLKGMYLLSASEQFRNTRCQPLAVLKDIQTIYPQLLTIQGETLVKSP